MTVLYTVTTVIVFAVSLAFPNIIHANIMYSSSALIIAVAIALVYGVAVGDIFGRLKDK